MSDNKIATEVGGNTEPQLPLHRKRAFCYTDHNINRIENPTDEDFKYDGDQMKYMIEGLEICPTTGKKHYQGYIYFHNAKTLGQVIKTYPGIHWEIAKGTPIQNRAYCSKDNNYIEFGELPEQGKRNDIHGAVKCILEKGIRETIDEHPIEYVKYNKGLEKILALKKTIVEEKKIIKIYDWKGEYKSMSAAYEKYPDLYRKNPGKWWDAYAGEETVLIENYESEDKNELNRWMNKFPIRVETKGGTIPLTCKRFILRIVKTREED